MKYYLDYVWRNGAPYGIKPTVEPFEGISYKVVSDPYHKRISIEQYQNKNFEKVIYDSALFDFRHLKLPYQTGWEKMVIFEDSQKAICHIRNQEDRLILIEEHLFKEGLCVECHAFSPLNLLLSKQKITYEKFKDPFNGVILYDGNNHQVLLKKYSIDKDNLFIDLLEEVWSC